MNKHSKLYYWLPAIIWMIIIFCFSARPAVTASGIDWQDFIIKKSAHFIEYFILTWLLTYSFMKTTGYTFQKILIYSVLIAVLFAVSDEVHQLFVSGRTSTVRDVLIDSTGSLVGYYFLRKKLILDITKL